MKRLLFFTGLLFLSFQSMAQTLVIDSILFDGVWRNYRLFLPTGFNANTTLPLVFNFHGYGSNALEQELYTQFDLVADTGNFLVCYPNGLNNSWNVLGGAPDDVGFTDSLITVLHSEYNIDMNRVYATGLSNGGFFSNLIACQIPDKITAIAPVAGTNTSAVQSACNPSRKVPILYIHGTNDAIVQYNGTVGYVSANALMQLWSVNNSCEEADTVAVPNISTTDFCTAEIITWRDCDSNKQVVHYRVIDGGHTWPGAPLAIGVTNQDFNASGVIWNFFNQFSLATGINETEKSAINVFPNPFTSELTINLPGTNCTVEIYSVDGRLMEKRGNVSERIIIDGKKFLTGFYLIRITTTTSAYTIPVVRAN